MRRLLVGLALLVAPVVSAKPLPPVGPLGPSICQVRYQQCVLGCSLSDPLSHAFCTYNCAWDLNHCGEGF